MKARWVKTHWIYNLDMDLSRLLEVSYLITNGFYYAQQYPVFPARKPYNQTEEFILIPDINYNGCKNYWELVREQAGQDLEFPIIPNANLLRFLRNQIPSDLQNMPDPLALREKWDMISDEFFELIAIILGKHVMNIQSVMIYLTHYGSNGSFKYIRNGDNTISVFLRENASLSTLMSLIIAAFTRENSINKLSLSWDESTAIVDWVMNETIIFNLISKYKLPNPLITLQSLRTNRTSNVMKQSKEFCRERNIPYFHPDFKVDRDDIYINKIKIISLTPREHEILTLLIKNQGQILDYDSIHTICKKDIEEFSLYMISKLIQRIRDKISEQGVTGVYISNVRNSGYVLV